jgi:hypothetical protein
MGMSSEPSCEYTSKCHATSAFGPRWANIILHEAGSRIKQAPRLDSNKGVVEYSDAIAFWVPQRRGQQGAAIIVFFLQSIANRSNSFLNRESAKFFHKRVLIFPRDRVQQ